MSKLRLVAPTIEREAEYLDMLNDWKSTGERMIPFVLKMNPIDFPAMVAKLHDYSRGIGIPPEFVPHYTYWLINENNRILGVANLRPRLNDVLQQRGGHIGYGIRPSERRKGYATKLLQLALEKARVLGIEKVLVTCDKNNNGSARVIRNNGGVLEDEVVVDGILIQRYWIGLKKF
jgi:predicted acetyltransferase